MIQIIVLFINLILENCLSVNKDYIDENIAITI